MKRYRVSVAGSFQLSDWPAQTQPDVKETTEPTGAHRLHS